MGRAIQGDPVAAHSYDGRLEVFARGAGGALRHAAQTDGLKDEWAPWESLGGITMVGNPAVASNADGRLAVFVAVAAGPGEYSLWHIWQTGSATYPFWSAWAPLGGRLLGMPVVARNRDGRLEVFARSIGNNLTHLWQTEPNANAWSAWEDLGGGTLVGDPGVGSNADGRLEVFVRATDGAVWHLWQTATVNITWSTWSRLGDPLAAAGDPVVAQDLDGRLEVFIRGLVGADERLWTARQTRSFSRSWSIWDNLQGQLLSDPAIGTNGDGRLEAFALAVDRGVYHLWQTPPIQWVMGSTKQLAMGNGDRLFYADGGTSVMHHGRLYIFFADGPAPEYADPIGVLDPTGGAADGAQGVDFSSDRDVSRDFRNFDYLRADASAPFFSGATYPVTFRVDTAFGPQALGQDQAPTGVFSYDDRVYAFAYAHLLPSGVPSNYPNHVPPGVPDGGDANGIGQSILTCSTDPAGAVGPFRLVFTLAQTAGKFNQVSPVVVKNAEIPGLPVTDAPDGLIMLGQGGAEPGVFLAWMPLRRGEDPRLGDLRFYVGDPAAPGPAWSSDATHASRLFGTRYFWSSISVGRIRSSDRWVVLYQKTLPDFANEGPVVEGAVIFRNAGEPAGLHPEERHDGIYARVARWPWAWSPEVKIFDPDREAAWGPDMIDEVGGFAYGAFLLHPYTNWDPATRVVTLNYLLSPGSPYGVMLMRSQIQINE
jgi:hypothetical protein